MNFKLNFTSTPAFARFKHGLEREDALELLLKLGQHCQIEKKTVLQMPHEFDWRLILGLSSNPEAAKARNSLLASGLVKQASGSADSFQITFFEESNASLVASWKNGSQGGRPKQKNQTNESTKELSNEINEVKE